MVRTDEEAIPMTVVESAAQSGFVAAWDEWHGERERYYRDPVGWVSLTGLYWLTEEIEAFADLPGKWRADADAAYVEGFIGADRLEPVEGAPGVLVDDGERRIEVIRRTGSVALRVHDPESPHLRAFGGIPTYPPSERWVVAGRFTPYERARTLTTGAVKEGLEHHHNAVGVIDFSIDGAAQQFVAFSGRDGGLGVLFTDATSGVTTYAACRSLAVAAPAADGSVVLDFNRASNLPCAFTDYATCPVAPAENRLSVSIEAGEKIPEFAQAK
jgi:uncharacterized protein